jgi:hypothetical protein
MEQRARTTQRDEVTSDRNAMQCNEMKRNAMKRNETQRIVDRNDRLMIGRRGREMLRSGGNCRQAIQ